MIAPPALPLSLSLPTRETLALTCVFTRMRSVKVWGGYGGVYMEGSAPQAASARPKLQLKQANSRNVRIFISSTFR